MNPAWPPGPACPVLDPGEVHVWRAELDAGGWPAAAALPAGERERAAALRGEPARTRWVAARWALRLVLARYLAARPGAVALATAGGGKPELATAGGGKPEREAGAPRFNLSHSGGLALVAVAAAREVGVDLERVLTRRDPLALADRWLEPAAAALVRSAPADERPAVFHAAWTRHEAARKCTGAGLAGVAPDGATLWTCDLAPGPGYAGALALAGAQAVAVRTWSLAPGATT